MDDAQSDPAAAGVALAQTLERHLGVGEVRVSAVTGAAGGYSGRILLFSAEWKGESGAESRDLVARIEPVESPLFLTADVLLEWRMMDALADVADVPVPKLVLKETDRSIFGAPFYVMEQVPGRIPQDTPPYHAAGFMVDDLSPAERAQMWHSGIDALASLHRPFDYRDSMRFLEVPEHGDCGLKQHMVWFRSWYDWVMAGDEHPILDPALDYLMAAMPKALPADCALWGDARPGNMIFAKDNTVAAIIDWEMAMLGPGEVDLAYWLVIDELLGPCLGVPRLEGLPTRAETISRYEVTRGYTVSNDLRYYEILAATRLAIIFLRFANVQAGVALPKDTDFGSNSNAVRKTAELMGMPVPELSRDMVAALGLPYPDA